MTRPPLTTEERAARLDDASARLTAAVESITTGADWQAWLAFAAKLPSYSARNTFMLYAQAFERGWDDLGHVAGYRTWVTLGRNVRKGEKGLAVLAPCKYQATLDDGTKETRVKGFTIAHVFASCQTEGTGEIPSMPRPELLTGEGPAGAWQALALMVKARGFDVELSQLDNGVNGLTEHLTKTVKIGTHLEPAAAVKTLAHELAHVILHDPDACDYRDNRGRVECEAESTAFLVCDGLGLATDAYSFGYVASWSRGDAKTVATAADSAVKCARSILEALAREEVSA